MIGKLIVAGHNREETRLKLIKYLAETRLTGLHSNRDFLVALARSEEFKQNRIHTTLVDSGLEKTLLDLGTSRDEISREHLACAAAMISIQPELPAGPVLSLPWRQIGFWRVVPEIVLEDQDQLVRVQFQFPEGKEHFICTIDSNDYQVSLKRSGRDLYHLRVDRMGYRVWALIDRSEVILDMNGHQYTLRRPDILDERYAGLENRSAEGEDRTVKAPLTGKVVQINYREGDEVSKGNSVLVIESMKMENKVLSPGNGRITGIEVSVGEQVRVNQLLATLDTV
jgi:acetyl/propionyl-CoA carboxylase alpha subunit